MSRIKFGLRFQLLAPVLLLLIFPCLVYLEIKQTSQENLKTQQHFLTANAILTSEIIAKQSWIKTPVIKHYSRFKDLYASRLHQPQLTLDGKSDEWMNVPSLSFDQSNLINSENQYQAGSLSFNLKIAANDTHLLVFVEVIDDVVVYREIQNLSIHRNDHIKLGLVDQNKQFHRYTIAAQQPNEVAAKVVSITGRGLRNEASIKGFWRATNSGYNVELQIPLTFIDQNFSLAVGDVDETSDRALLYSMGTSDPTESATLGTVLLYSKDGESQLQKLRPLNIEVFDNFERLLATNIATDSASANSENNQKVMGTDLVASVALQLKEEELGKLVIRQPIAAIQTQEKAALNKLAVQSVLVVTLGILIWVLIVSMVTRRIRRLKQEIESAVDMQGRVHPMTQQPNTTDELGELSISFANITRRLQQYNQYLESMASRLAHELRTPISVVRSSLENLNQEQLTNDASTYVERAHEGVNRLTRILNKMAEATRLEQSLDEDEIETFDLNEVVRGCLSGHEIAYPSHQFNLSLEAESVILSGIPDLIAQLLDKLISNAVEFSNNADPIKVRLTIESEEAVLRVINDGPTLPQEMRGKIFDSMVSMRQGYDSIESHLGLGLYIAKIITDFHGGTISAADREDTRGVIITVKIPLMRISSKLA